MDLKSIDSYNRHGVLRTPVALYLSLFVLTKQSWMAIAVALSHGKSKMGATGGLAWDSIEYWPIAWEIPALIIGLALLQRAPKGPNWARKVWPTGLWMLRIAALAQLGLAAMPMTQLEFMSDDFVVRGVLLCATSYALGYLMLSKYLPHYFKEFPEPPPEEAK